MTEAVGCFADGGVCFVMRPRVWYRGMFVVARLSDRCINIRESGKHEGGGGPDGRFACRFVTMEVGRVV